MEAIWQLRNTTSLVAILDRLRFIAEATKTFDANPMWEEVPSRLSPRLSLVVAIRLDGILRGGVSLRFATPKHMWEEDVYGHIEVRLPGVVRTLRNQSNRVASSKVP